MTTPSTPTSTMNQELRQAAAQAKEALTDVVTHHGDFTTAVAAARSLAMGHSEQMYWDHQRDVLDRMKTQARAALSALSAVLEAPTDEAPSGSGVPARPTLPGELQPCPFCGNASPHLDDCRTIWAIRCYECEACVLGERAPEPNGSGSPEYWERIKQTAITAWNRRALAASPVAAPSVEPNDEWLATAIALADKYAEAQSVADSEGFTNAEDRKRCKAEAEQARVSLHIHLAASPVAAPSVEPTCIQVDEPSPINN